MSNIFRIVKSALQNFRRHGLLSFTAITIMIVAILSIGVVMMVNIVIGNSLTVVEKKLNLSVELYDGLSEKQILDLKSEFEKQSIIDKVEYTSKNLALEEFKESFKSKGNIIEFVESLDKNPLYATFTIMANNVDDYENVKLYLDQPAFEYLIKEIKDKENQSERIETFKNISYTVRNIGLGVSLFFAIVTLFTVFATIKIGIHNRKQEISIMEFVGASYFYIVVPFVLEGIFYSIIAFVLSFGAGFLVFLNLQTSSIPFIGFVLDTLKSFYIEFNFEMTMLPFIIVLMLGGVSSYAAIFSYLHKGYRTKYSF